MGIINEIKIEIQRWIHRRRRSSFKRNDDKLMLEAIQKADQFTAERGHRLWVIKIAPGNYRIFTKGQVRAFFRTVSAYLPGDTVNIYKTSDYIIHITRKAQ